MKQKYIVLAAVVATSIISGCAVDNPPYRIISNVKETPDPVLAASTSIIISEDDLPGQKYTSIGPIELTIEKRSAFHEDPNRISANFILREKAFVLGADAIINVTYRVRVCPESWSCIDAKGIAVKLNK